MGPIGQLEMIQIDCHDPRRLFMRVLPKRLGKFGLRLNLSKTHLLAFDKRQARRMLAAKQRPVAFDYLGFTHYRWLRRERNARKLPDLWQVVARKVSGHLNYCGITDNSRALKQFRMAGERMLFKWLDRWSQRHSFTWESLVRCKTRYPLPRTRRLVPLDKA